MVQFSVQYRKEDLRLFTDSSKTSLKAVLLHNGNAYAPLSISYSTHLKENYKKIELVLNKSTMSVMFRRYVVISKSCACCYGCKVV